MRSRIAAWMACALAASGCSVATDFGRFVLADDAGAGGMDAGGLDAARPDDAGDDAARPDGGADVDSGGGDVDAGDTDASMCAPGAEVCDGADNDCDMMVDEGGAGCTLPHAMATCTEAECRVVTCNTGYGDCSGGAADGCESDLRTTANCGACGARCTGAEICDTSGATPRCATTCSGTLCSGTMCVDLLTDAANCGMCGRACSTSHATASCTAGSCTLACAMGWGNCDGLPGNGCEASLDTPMNCGTCGDVCPPRASATPSCSAGTCVWTCTAGHLDCNGMPDDGCEATPTTYLQDSDADGYGGTVAMTGCPMAGWTTRGGDCDDSNAAVRPGAREVCSNGVDDNCNSMTDEGCAPNDTCAGAIAIPFNTIGRHLGDFAMVADGLDGAACPGGLVTYKDAYFYVDIPEAGALVYLDTLGSGADTVLANESGCSGLPPAGCLATHCGRNAGSTFLQIGSVAPGSGLRRWYFSVRLPAGAPSRAFRLNYEILPLPLARFEAVAPGVGTASYTGVTGMATTASAYPFCFMPSGPEDVYYWTQCPTAGRSVRVENAATNCPVPWNQSLELIGPFSDVTGSLLICATGMCPSVTTAIPDPGLYVVAVDGTGVAPGMGSYRLTLTIAPALP